MTGRAAETAVSGTVLSGWNFIGGVSGREPKDTRLRMIYGSSGQNTLALRRRPGDAALVIARISA